MLSLFKRRRQAADKAPSAPTTEQQLAQDIGMTMNDSPAFTQIQQEIDDSDVVLFMKGTPMFPQCGFSAAVVQALTLSGVKFKDVDVLTDPGVREGIKQFSNWPTIPQLYVKGEFVGGCDIIREMHETGELQKVFEEKGVESEATSA
jgi:monothiol glutaredoxin